MNSLTKGIESAIKNAIEEYSSIIASKYDDIDQDDLEQLWNDVSKDIKISVSFKTSSKASPESSRKKSSPIGTDTCPYTYIKGANKGENCGAKAREGCTHCSKHKKHEGTTPKEKTVLP